MAIKGFGAAITTCLAVLLAFATLYPGMFTSSKESYAITTFDTALLREQIHDALSAESTKVDINTTLSELEIPDWYSLHMRTLCQGNWMTSTSSGSKAKDPLGVSCEVPAAITGWKFSLGPLLLPKAEKYPRLHAPRWGDFPYRTILPQYRSYSHHMGVPASLLLAAAIMAMVNVVTFLDLAAHRPRLPRYVHYQAVFFQFVAAICASAAAWNLVGFAQKSNWSSTIMELDFIFELRVHSGIYFQQLITATAFVFWVSAIVALRAALRHCVDGQLVLPVHSSPKSLLLAFQESGEPDNQDTVGTP